MNDPTVRSRSKKEEDEHVLHFRETCPFEIGSDFDYLRDGWGQTVLSVLLRIIIVPLLSVFNYIALGFRVYGRKNLKALKKRGAVTVCNHIHPLDCTMIYLALWNLRGYFVTLDTNFKIPFARHLIRLLGGIPISKNPHQVNDMLLAAGKALSRGNYVQIYPEAVLKPYCHTLRNFHPGAFRIAADNNAPVLPMILTLERPRGFFAWYKRKRCLRLHILPPVEPDMSSKKRSRIEKLQRQCLEAMTQKRIERRRIQRKNIK
ncbi:MAG TPA: lysophospholipid acyltransferase family protein [Oscillospiraceae bacterium]|nr:lysophospholipid acyltransferase family protein [Oscillospiraceae bacterium]HPS36009.1 lysophospholipid acyltransferase family protein [Oscillospiraceae bacterium]